MEEGNSSNKNNLTSSMKNKSRVSKLATGRPPLHPSSLTNAAAPRRRREQDQHIPISNIIRVMRQILPASANICDEAKETIQECISKFINHITEEANKIRSEEQRKVLTADDIVAAMFKKRFESYADLLSTYLYRYREAEGKDDFIQVLRLRLLRPDAGMVPPPVMADPYFYPHDVGTVNSTMTNFDAGSSSFGSTFNSLMPNFDAGSSSFGSTFNSTMPNFDAGSSSFGSTVNSTMTNFDAGSSSCGSTVNSTMMNFDAESFGSTFNSTMTKFDVGSSSFGSTVNSTMTNFDAGSSSYGSTVNSTMTNFDAGSSSFGKTVNSTMTNFDAGSSSFGSTFNSTMMNFDAGSSCNSIGGGCNEYDGHWYGVTGIGGGRRSEYTGQGYDSTINPMMTNFVGSYNNNFGGYTGQGYDSTINPMADIDGGHGMVDISGCHGESVNQRYGDGLVVIGGGSGQYADHGYGVDIGGGGAGENVDQGYASTTNNSMMSFGVLEIANQNEDFKEMLVRQNMDLWSRRNDKIFNGKELLHHMIIERVQKLVEDCVKYLAKIYGAVGMRRKRSPKV
uniref:Transcription factor CBF/NF-Y/archaeal histone domain-containing protein n=1 Tax=Chenopodium quinoa TaxID=63459 RepID=A0A803LQ78_CHEQI